MSREPDPTRNSKIIAMRKDGVGPREIARRLEVSPNVVAGVLHRAGLTTEERGRGFGAGPEFKKYAVEYLSRHTWRQTAEDLGISHYTLWAWRHELKSQAA